MTELPLIGRGRAADVFDVGGGRVLRRYRAGSGGSVVLEAAVMRHLHAHGAPVPEVFDADGTDLVMERLTGPTMMDTLRSAPWRAARVGRELAEVQRRLHAVPAGGLDVRRLGDGDSVLHLDLHPDNVIVTDRGPVVIDWTNAAVGDPLADVMTSWMLMATGSPDGVSPVLRPILQRVRRSLVDGFVSGTPIDDRARRWVNEVCRRRLDDPNTRDDERVRVRAFATAHGSGS